MQTQLQAISVSSPECKSLDSSVEIEIFDEPSKRKKKTQALSVFLILALLSLFIPIAHFFLVPAFLIAAVFSWKTISKQKGQLLRSELTCPACGKVFCLTAQPLRFPIETFCDHCRKSIHVTEKN